MDANVETEVKDAATTKTEEGTMETKKPARKAAPKTNKGGSKMKVDYADHKAWSAVVIEMALKEGMKVAKDYGKAILKQGLIKAPWDNPMHCMKAGVATDLELLLKAVAIIKVKKDNPDNNIHVIEGVLGKLKGNFAAAPHNLKKDEDCIKAAKKYVKNAK
jgi:hypothetical protein